MAKLVVVFGDQFKCFLELLRSTGPLGLASEVAAGLKMAAEEIHLGVGFAGAEVIDETGQRQREPDGKQKFSHERGFRAGIEYGWAGEWEEFISGD